MVVIWLRSSRLHMQTHVLRILKILNESKVKQENLHFSDTVHDFSGQFSKLLRAAVYHAVLTRASSRTDAFGCTGVLRRVRTAALEVIVLQLCNICAFEADRHGAFGVLSYGWIHAQPLSQPRKTTIASPRIVA